MRPGCFLIVPVVLLAAATDPGIADRGPSRLTRVQTEPARADTAVAVAADTAPAGSAPSAEARRPVAVERPVVPPRALLEPDLQLAGTGRDAVASFQVQADDAMSWELTVAEVGGPVARVFRGEGPPPARIVWDGRLHDGGFAWSGLTYTYRLTSVDTAGAVGAVAGADFTLPGYVRTDHEGLTILLAGAQVAPRRRVVRAGLGSAFQDGPPAQAADPVAAAAAGLRRTVRRLESAPPWTRLQVEVLGPDRAAALALGRAVRQALIALLARPGLAVDLYVGAAPAATVDGAVRITARR